jgi:hypothetical protein
MKPKKAAAVQPVQGKYGRLLGARDAAIYIGTTTLFLRALITRRELTVVRNPNGRLLGVYEFHLRAWQEPRLAPAPVTRSISQQMLEAQLQARLPKKRHVFVAGSRFD